MYASLVFKTKGFSLLLLLHHYQLSVLVCTFCTHCHWSVVVGSISLLTAINYKPCDLPAAATMKLAYFIISYNNEYNLHSVFSCTLFVKLLNGVGFCMQAQQLHSNAMNQSSCGLIIQIDTLYKCISAPKKCIH